MTDRPLREVIADLADELEAELTARYEHSMDYPSQKSRFERDMATVYEARQALALPVEGWRPETNKLPHEEGFWWGQWHTKSPGSADMDDAPFPEWEVMHVVENSLDEDDDDFLMVMVPGAAKWQSLQNFRWGPRIPAPPAPDRGGEDV
jgi:hypothetical protein